MHIESAIWLNYWPTNGFMVGDNATVDTYVADGNGNLVSNTGIAVAQLFDTYGNIMPGNVLTSSNIDLNQSMSIYDYGNAPIINVNSSVVFGNYSVITYWSNGNEGGNFPTLNVRRSI